MNSQIAQEREVSGGLRLLGLLECMRPQQWVKNGFVLAVLVFSSHLTDPVFVWRAFLAFTAFCITASGIYLWNDTLDRTQDLAHPEKKHRPIASGRLSPAMAMTFGSACLIAGVASAFAVSGTTGLILLTYATTNILYVLWLKHIVILDVMCIALGFVFRVMAGAAATDVKPSNWLLLCTFLLALFLGVSKRRQEVATLATDGSKHRKVLGDYSIAWLDQAGTMLAGTAVVAYALYTMSPETQARFRTDHLIYTVPFVLYGILRYMHRVHFSSVSGNPSAALLGDRPLLICIAGWLAACAAIIYT